MWRLSGIFREVQLWVRPLVHIADYRVTAVPNADFSQAEVTAVVSICNTGKKKATACPVMIIDGLSADKTELQINAGDTTNCVFHYTLEHPRLWSAEKPNLYPFSVELEDKKGNTIEHFDYHFGVKRVECVGEVFKINGKNVKLRGVNRHDHHPRTGRYVDDATYEQDLRLMKQANINFLRTFDTPSLITAHGGVITVRSEVDGLPVAVYTIDGKLTGSATVSNGQAMVRTPLTDGEVTIVRIGEKAVKVVMK